MTEPNILSVDHAIEILDDLVVQTKQGPFIKVEDLKKLAEDFREAKIEARPTGEGLKTLRGARRAAMSDPELLKTFEEKPPKAPADADVVKPVADQEEEKHGAEAA